MTDLANRRAQRDVAVSLHPERACGEFDHRDARSFAGGTPRRGPTWSGQFADDVRVKRSWHRSSTDLLIIDIEERGS